MLTQGPRKLHVRIAILVLVVAGIGSGANNRFATAAVGRSLQAGNVYVAFPSWYPNCPGGGTVYSIQAANGDLWSTPPEGDSGDDLIYPKVYLGLDNTITAKLTCRRSVLRVIKFNVPGAYVSVDIRPTRTGETFWVGPLPGELSHN